MLLPPRALRSCPNSGIPAVLEVLVLIQIVDQWASCHHAWPFLEQTQAAVGLSLVAVAGTTQRWG